MPEWIPFVVAALALLAAGFAAGRGWHRAALGLLGVAAGAGGWAAGRATARAHEGADEVPVDGAPSLAEETHPDAPPRELLPRPIPDYIEEAHDEARYADPRRTGDADYARDFADRGRADGVID